MVMRAFLLDVAICTPPITKDFLFPLYGKNGFSGLFQFAQVR